MFIIATSVPIRQRAKGNATVIHAIKTRVCALFISLFTLILGIIGGVETQVKMFEALVDELVANDLL